MEKNMGFFAWLKSLPLQQMLGGILITAILLYALFGFLAAPLILKTVLAKKLPPVLDRPMAIEKIRLNPFTLSATVEGFRLGRKEGDGDFIYFDRLHVNLESMSIFKKSLIIRSVALEAPFIDFDLLDKNVYSFSDLLEIGSVKEKKNPETTAPLNFSINNIIISSGNINFHDLTKEKVHRVVELNLSIPSFSNMPSSIETYTQPAFSAVINGTKLALDGQTKPFAESLATEVDIKMKGINIPDYLKYIPNHTDLTLKSAMMDVDAKLSYLSNADQGSRLTLTGRIDLRGLNMVDLENRTYLKIPSLTVVSADSNLLAKEIHLADITISNPQLALFRLAGGELAPFSLLASPGNDADVTAEDQNEKSDEEGMVKLVIDNFTIDEGEVVFTDQALQNSSITRIDKISLRAESLATIPETTGKFSFAMLVNNTGKISGAGELAITPLNLRSSLEINSVELKDFQPYISEQARIVMAGGSAALQGEFRFKKEQSGGDAISFTGGAAVSNLATVDTLAGDDLLKWQDLQVKGLSFSSNPPELLVDEISWDGPYAKVLVTDDGTINFAALVGNEPPAENETPTRADPAAKELGGRDDSGPKPKITVSKILLTSSKLSSY